MYCPICGGKLVLVAKYKCPEIDWNETDLDKLNVQIKAAQDWEEIQREEYECVGKGCFRKDYPLYFHQPFQGINSAPGDSWSLSWIK